MLVGTTVTYVIISQYRLIWDTMKSFARTIRHPNRKALDDFDHPHSRLMSQYAEVPDWWYLVIFLSPGVQSLLHCIAWPSMVPVSTVIIIFMFNIAVYIPTLIILSRTGYSTGFSTLAVLLSGYMDPGNPVTNIFNRMWGYNVDEAAPLYGFVNQQ
ncbi:OPT oligopeptide transporter protein-domain-containing protein [Lipomyces doorenjongii]